MSNKGRINKVLSLLPRSASRRITWTMEAIDIAAEEIEHAKARHPEATRAIEDSFFRVRPTEVLYGISMVVVRSHIRELLERAARGEDMKPGTEAECLRALLDLALVTPIDRQALALTDRLFESVMGTRPDNEVQEPEPWAGASDELLAELRRKLRCDR